MTFLFLSFIVSRQPVKQIAVLGISLFADKFKILALKAGVGILSGSIFFFNPIGVINLTTALLGGAIIFNVAQGISDFECKSLVSKVPIERVFEEKTIGFLETHPKKTPKVFIKAREDMELYIPSYSYNDCCFSEYEQVEVKKSTIMTIKTEPQTRIYRKCEKEYVLLKKRTKTLADLKKEDSTEN